MSITITKADVKRKCMIPSTDETYDSSIDSLISEMQPAVVYTIADVYLSDTGNTNLQALLQLGVLEIISGEFLQQLAREMGNTEEFSVGGVTIGEMKEHGSVLIQQGASRLAPFIASIQPMMSDSGIAGTTEDVEPVFNLEDIG